METKNSISLCHHYYKNGYNLNCDYYVDMEVFCKEEKAMELYVKYVADFFKTTIEAMWNILNYYDVFAERDMLEAFVDEFNDELDDIFWDY